MSLFFVRTVLYYSVFRCMHLYTKQLICRTGQVVSYLSACTKLFGDKCMHKYANHMEYNKRGPGMTYTQQNSNIALNWLSNRVSEEITNPKQLNISVLYDKLYSFAFAILFYWA